MMPAAWLSTMSPADAARKKTIQRRQNTLRRRSASSGTMVVDAAPSATPECAMSHAAITPVTASTTAKPPSVARTPIARIDHPKSGAAIIAPAG